MYIHDTNLYEYKRATLRLHVYNMWLVRSLFFFGCSSHHLTIETGRWSNTTVTERICSYWTLTSNISVIEDEKHVLYDCSLYEDLRKKYLDDLVLVGDAWIDESSVCDLGYAWRSALYIYHGMKKRLSAMSLWFCGTMGREDIYSWIKFETDKTDKRPILKFWLKTVHEDRINLF